jgi:antitoxin ParD1/3/4
MPTMNVSLPNDLNDFVVDQVTHGGYNNQSEVVREGLRLLRSRREKLMRLRSDIDAGAADIERGGTQPLTEQLLAEIENRARE